MTPYQDHNYLFADGDLWSVLRSHFEGIPKRVDAIPKDIFDAMSDESLLEQLSSEFLVNPLVLNESGLEMTQEEIKVDVSGDFRRALFSDRGPFYVDGVRVTVIVPYTGDAILWRLKPNEWQTIFPQGEIRESEGTLHLAFEQPTDEEPARIKEALDRALENIRFYVGSQHRQIAAENLRLPELLRQAISRRRASVNKHGNLSNLLNIPVKKVLPGSVDASSQTAPTGERLTTPRSSRHERGNSSWDVFVCHASEDKIPFVRDLAQALQTKAVKVWYDDFTLKVGDSLRRSIDRGLSLSRYGIVVISHNFLNKEWPQKELDGLTAREVEGRKVILPVWHNIDAQTVRSYSPILSDRLATSSSKGLNQVVADLLQVIETSESFI